MDQVPPRTLHRCFNRIGCQLHAKSSRCRSLIRPPIFRRPRRSGKNERRKHQDESHEYKAVAAMPTGVPSSKHETGSPGNHLNLAFRLPDRQSRTLHHHRGEPRSFIEDRIPPPFSQASTELGGGRPANSPVATRTKWSVTSRRQVPPCSDTPDRRSGHRSIARSARSRSPPGPR